MKQFPVTPRGLAQLQKELRHLVYVKRQEISEEIARTRGYGDLSENAEYHAAKEKQHFVEKRIHELETKINQAQVIDISILSGPSVYFGATVVLFDEDARTRSTYQIVGEDEADIKNGKLSVASLLARELIGKAEGMAFEFVTPSGEKCYKIESVSYVVDKDPS